MNNGKLISIKIITFITFTVLLLAVVSPAATLKNKTENKQQISHSSIIKDPEPILTPSDKHTDTSKNNSTSILSNTSVTTTIPPSDDLPFNNDLYPLLDHQDNSPYALGKILVKFKEELLPLAITVSKEGVVQTGDASLDLLNQQYQVSTMRKVFRTDQPRLAGVYTLTLPENTDIRTVVNTYQNNPGVEYAEPSYQYALDLIPNDPYYDSYGSWAQDYPDLYGLHLIDTDTAWDRTTGSHEVIVAMVDTGVDYTHEDLQDNMWINDDEIPENNQDDDGDGFIDNIYGADFYYNDGIPEDGFGHGTHCAGTIAAIGNNARGVVGVNWNAKIMAVKIGSSGGGLADVEVLADAVVWAAAQGADVISMSWGGPAPDQTLDLAMQEAHALGACLVAAAGNSNSRLFHYPAAYDNVIAVAATDWNDQKAFFSNYGDWIDVSAPGVNILSLRAVGTDMYNDGGTHVVGEKYYRASGTSMACPHVAGLAALLLAIAPFLSDEQIAERMRETADTIDAMNPGYERLLGGGRINASRTVHIYDHNVGIQLFHVSDTLLSSPETIFIDTIIENTGLNSEENIVISFWVDDVQVDSSVIPLLAPYEDQPVSFQWVLPAFGVYHLSVNVTLSNGNEGYYEDNMRTEVVRVGICNINTEHCFTTIQDAIDDAETRDGDTILVPTGIYGESLRINKNISVIGEDRDTTVVEAPAGAEFVASISQTIAVTFSGFTLRQGQSGLILSASSNTIITDMIITDCIDTGIIVTSSNNILITQSIIAENQQGINITGGSSATVVKENDITGNEKGLHIDVGSSQILIYHNNFDNNENAYDAGIGNRWNDTYYVDARLSGGNFWGDYPGVDQFLGPEQNWPFSDSIGDTPYEGIDGGQSSQDWYPLMEPYTGPLPMTFHVDDNNTVGPWYGTPDYPYQHIQNGVDAAIPGDTVYVRSGLYEEMVSINREQIHLIGEDPETTFINGISREVIIINADQVTISRFTITCNFDGIVVNSNDNIISDNIVMNCLQGNGAIYLCWGMNNTVTRNILKYNTFGVSLGWTGTEDIISENIFTDSVSSWFDYSWSILLMPVGGSFSGIIISNNTITDGSVYGIWLYYAWGSIDNILICGNTVVSSDIDMDAFTLEPDMGSCHDLIITSNTIGYFLVEGSVQNLVINENRIDRANLGRYCVNALIYHNNFYGSAIDEGTDNMWDYGYPSGGNYWDGWEGGSYGIHDDYHGENQNISGGDGILDQGEITGGGLNPHSVGGSFDWYPLMFPYGPLCADANGPYEGGVNAPVQFTGSAHGGSPPYTSWSWDFGDDQTSDEQCPVHFYSDIGVFVVTLTVTDSGRNIDINITTTTIQVLFADANGPYQSVIYEPVPFIGSVYGGSPEYIWYWDFGDGNTSMEQNPTHTYSQADTYTVVLTVTDSEGNSDSDTATAFIFPFADVWVDDDFNENTPGWEVTAFNTIQNGINAIVDDGTVYVFNGIYEENVLINKPITLTGEDKEHTNISAEYEWESVVSIIVDRVNITGFTIRESTEAGVHITSNFNIIQGNIITDNYLGIYLQDSSYNVIMENTISENDKGLFVRTSSNNTFIGNYISHNSNGFWFVETSSNNTITRNTITNNSCAVQLRESSRANLISYNTIEDGGGIQIRNSPNTIITENTMRRSGISLFQSSTTIIAGNNITDSDIALQISTSDYTVISENRMSTVFFEGSSHITVNENMFHSGGIAFSNNENDNIACWNTHSINDNTLNSKPIYYYKNSKEMMNVPADAAQVILANCSNVTIQGLNITNVASGIQLGFSSHNTISRNTITAIRLQVSSLFAALFLIQSSNNTISENIMSDSTVGILAWTLSHHTIIEKNSITHNDNGLLLFYSDNAQILENNISDNGNGLYAEESNEDVIARNTIKNNHQYGITGGSSHSDIFENTIQDNDGGIYLATSYTRLYHNNFINNRENAYDRGNNIWNSSYPSGGNYWDDYTGVDEYSGPEQNISGSDGIGDIPYEALQNCIDWYPLMNPYVAHLQVYAHGPYEGVVNIPLQFTGSASGGCPPYISWYWEFGDGENATEQNPIHTYYDVGVYTATLTVTDNQGNTSSDCTTATIQVILADANGPYQNRVNEPIQFVGAALGGSPEYIWYWDFGDGNTSMEQNPTHNYSQADTYTVVLSVTDSEGNSDSDTTTALVQSLADVWVDDDFNESTPGWGVTAFNNIQDGVDHVVTGNIVYVFSGIYYEKVVITAPIQLVGENKDTTIIDGIGVDDVVVIVSANNVTITGFTIQDSHSDDVGGVWVVSDFTTITENVIRQCSYGIVLHSEVTNTVIANNTVTSNTIGVHLFDSDYNTIGENEIIDNAMGIYLVDSNYNNIIGNTISNSFYEGIVIEDFQGSAIGNQIYHNNFLNTQGGNAYDNCGSNNWDNGYPSGGNHWDDYTGSDNNSDGIGDESYNIEKYYGSGVTGWDRYPFMEANGWDGICPVLSFVTFAGGGLVTCPAGDGPTYQYMAVTVRDFDGEPIPGIPAEEFAFLINPLDDTYVYGLLSCTFTSVDSQTNANGEIRFTIQGDTTIVGNITIQVTVLGVSLNDVETLPCKSPDYFADGAVILGDFVVFGQDYGKAWYRSDFTWDGMVNMLDFVMFGQHWGHHHH